jgi:glucan phosphorylase
MQLQNWYCVRTWSWCLEPVCCVICDDDREFPFVNAASIISHEFSVLLSKSCSEFFRSVFQKNQRIRFSTNGIKMHVWFNFETNSVCVKLLNQIVLSKIQLKWMNVKDRQENQSGKIVKTFFFLSVKQVFFPLKWKIRKKKNRKFFSFIWIWKSWRGVSEM